MVANKKQFNPQLTIKTPLISAYNPDVFSKCMDSISVKKFILFFQKNAHIKEKAQKYPILAKLSLQPELFWCIDKLLDISNWIRLIHSKYMGTLTITSCNKLKINDIFGHVKLNEWGDEQE